MKSVCVAIVGRPNVGKSSLFNKILGKQVSIVHDRPGVTRDRLYAQTEWRNTAFLLIDTGGLNLLPDDGIIEQVKVQVEVALSEASVIIFVVDAKEGLTPADFEIADLLRKTEKRVILVVNKSDNPKRHQESMEFYQLGLGEIFPISAIHGHGVPELLDEVVASLPQAVTLTDETVGAHDLGPKSLKMAVIGKPNVGKSSLINAILGQERVIVDHRPGTTRDAVNISFQRDGCNFEFVDTAGMRRKNRIVDDLEKSSVGKAIKSIKESDITWLIIDAAQGPGHQDKTIAGFIMDEGKACILVVSKWDLVEKDNKTYDLYQEALMAELPFLDYVPAFFVSAVTKQRIYKLLELSQHIYREYSMRAPTHLLNESLEQITLRRQHPTVSGKRVHLKYMTQVGTCPPTFLTFTNWPNLIDPAYERYLIHRLRERFGFYGSPIRIEYRRG